VKVGEADKDDDCLVVPVTNTFSVTDWEEPEQPTKGTRIKKVERYLRKKSRPDERF
jgi:hypothetical protein